MVYVTGDFHGEYKRFSAPEYGRLKKGDTLIVCGDFGFVWENTDKEKKQLKKIGKKKFNTVFVTGCHDNYEALAEYPAYYEEQYGEPLDEEIYNIMAIPDEERERCEIYVNLPQETLRFYDKLWTQLGV